MFLPLMSFLVPLFADICTDSKLPNSSTVRSSVKVPAGPLHVHEACSFDVIYQICTVIDSDFGSTCAVTSQCSSWEPEPEH